MEEPITLWEVMEIIKQLPFGDKVRLLEELNSDIEWDLRADQYAHHRQAFGPSKRDEVQTGSEVNYESPHDAWRTFKYDETN